MTRIMSLARAAAVKANARFFLGTPCAKRHSGRRYTKTGACVECVALQDRTGRVRHPSTTQQGVQI